MKRILPILLTLVTLSCFGQTPIKMTLAQRIFLFLCPCLKKEESVFVTQVYRPQLKRAQTGEFKYREVNGQNSPEIEFIPIDEGETGKIRTVFSQEDLQELKYNEDLMDEKVEKLENAVKEKITQKLKEMEVRLDKIKEKNRLNK